MNEHFFENKILKILLKNWKITDPLKKLSDLNKMISEKISDKKILYYVMGCLEESQGKWKNVIQSFTCTLSLCKTNQFDSCSLFKLQNYFPVVFILHLSHKN